MEHHDAPLTNLLGLQGLDGMLMATLAALVLWAIAFAGRRPSLDKPNFFQQILELAVGGFSDFMKGIIHEQPRKHFAFLATFFFFILVGNMFSFVPGLAPPATEYNYTFALAILSFVYYNMAGVKAQGIVGHIKHLFGPVLFLAPLMFVIEVISHLARMLSLSMRLFGNISGEHVAGSVFYEFAGGFVIPIPMMALGLLGSFLQAFVFALLSMVYVGLATEKHGH